MFSRLIEILEIVIITTGLSAATLLLFANVVARYFFDTGFTWVLEAVQYLFAWVVLIGSAYGFKTGAHLGIDILVGKFSVANQRRLALLSLALCLIFVGTVLKLSIEYTVRIKAWGDLSLDLQIPQWIPYMAIPIGLSLMLLHLLEVGYNIWKGTSDRVHAREASELLEEIHE